MSDEEEYADMDVTTVMPEDAATSEKEPVADVEPEKVETETEGEPEGKPEGEEETSEEEVDQEPEGEPESKEDKGKKNGVQERINKLTLKRKEAERRAEAAEQRANELEGRKQVDQDNQREPNIDDFEDYEAYEKKLVDFKVGERLKIERQEHATRTQQVREQELAKSFNERVVKAEIEGFQESSQALIESNTLPPQLINVLLEHEKGPELVNFLGNHLDVSDSLNNVSPQQALLKLGELSANLSNVKKTKQITKAPDPISTIKSSGTKAKDFDDMDVGDIIESLRKKKR